MFIEKFDDAFLGVTFDSVTRNGESIEFRTKGGDGLVLKHNQQCCEDVCIEDIAGDLGDLEGSPILSAEEAYADGDGDDPETTLWTFYKFRTLKGDVTIRFFGSSNGYYSVDVDLFKMTKSSSVIEKILYCQIYKPCEGSKYLKDFTHD